MQLPNRDQLERSAAYRLSRLNARHRRELEEHLGNPPDINNVPDEFWDRVEDDVRSEAAIILLLIFGQSAALHGLGAAEATAQAAAYAERRAPELARDYVSNSRQSLSGAARTWQAAEAARSEGGVGTLVRLPRTEILKRTISIFGPDRAERIAVNETTRAQFDGGETARRSLGQLNDLDIWYTRNDSRVCPICEPLHNTRRTVWQSEHPEGPPAHVNCRCWISYAADFAGDN